MPNPAVNYHFKPADGDHESPHVCEVAAEKHINRFLSIKESFTAAGKVPANVAKELKQAADEKARRKQQEEEERAAGSIPVSEETMQEITEALVALMDEIGTETKPVADANDIRMTNKIVSDFLADQADINVKNKGEIIKFANGCDIEVNENAQPGKMIKEILNVLLERFTVEEGEESDLGADADTDEHARALTDTDDEEAEEGAEQ
ncbi:MAG: hypothetical protein Q8N34_03225 [Gammaproteobacteria bacterium]|nr:hypothetical protein [Gammaproteobacteria bacterium]